MRNFTSPVQNISRGVGIQLVRIGGEGEEGVQNCLQERFYEGNDDVFKLGLSFLRQRTLFVNGTEQCSLITLEMSKEIYVDW